MTVWHGMSIDHSVSMCKPNTMYSSYSMGCEAGVLGGTTVEQTTTRQSSHSWLGGRRGEEERVLRTCPVKKKKEDLGNMETFSCEQAPVSVSVYARSCLFGMAWLCSLLMLSCACLYGSDSCLLFSWTFMSLTLCHNLLTYALCLLLCLCHVPF